ncbi:AAA family ATPase [Paenibacillus pasadenensis]|uniref:ATP-binding protein n=1 Tax=Paenibacillus pasadenensis TaxID=217090 RepID=UPI00203C1A05|nr:AAA family ATPase [Paenibacillus pasadenensis]MCM3749003.1 AAA family ATPase [Paenibacillus pasadenensis]
MTSFGCCEAEEVLITSDRTIVYRGRDINTGEAVLIKTFRAGAGDSYDMARLRHEERLMGRLSHGFAASKHARHYGPAAAGGVYALIFRDSGGEPLETVLERKPDIDELLELAVEVCELLRELHECNFIYGDLKPGSLLWNREKRIIQPIELGSAVEAIGREPRFNSVYGPRGTFPFRSPEQTGRMNRRVDDRADYYALGIILYSGLTGKPPYTAEEQEEQIHYSLAKLFVSPFAATGGKVSPFLSAIVMRLLAKEPDERYRSIEGIKADLLKARQGQWEGITGEADSDWRFRLSQRLYGRDTELDKLRSLLKISGSGTVVTSLIHGDAGAGKTALVQELRPDLARMKGYFLEGRFDSSNRHLPYAAIAEALRGWLDHMLSRQASRKMLLTRSHQLMEELQGCGSLITALIPELEQLIGRQPLLEPLNPKEDSNRFYSVFVRFITFLASSGPPMILFLDDVHNADAPSLLLLEKLSACEHPCRLLVLLACRDQEADRTVEEALERFRLSSRVLFISLQPLGWFHVEEMVGGSLNMNAMNRERLSAALLRSTKGNVFFIHELLFELHRCGGLYYDEQQGEWNWREQTLRQISSEGDALHFLTDRLGRLPEHMRRILSLASIIGGDFHYGMLLRIGKGCEKELLSSLSASLEEGLLSAGYESIELLRFAAAELESGLFQAPAELTFRFRHGRLQQAFSAMLTPEESAETHLWMAQMMMDQQEEEPQDYRLVHLALHLCQGLDVLIDAEERMNAIHLMARAAHRAKLAHGYETAYMLLERIRPLLPPSGLTQTSWLRAHVNRLYAECSFLTWRVREAEEACQELLFEAASPYAAAEVRAMQSSHYMYLGMLAESLSSGRNGLQLLGVILPAKPTKLHVLKGLVQTKLALRKKNEAELLAGPSMKEPSVLLKMRLLINMFPSAFISGQPELFSLLAFKKVELTLQHGVAAESAFAFIGYSMLLSGTGDAEGAFRYGRLGVNINEKFNDVQWRGAVLTLYTLFDHGWKQSWHTLPEWFERAVFSCQQAGDLMYQAHASYYRNLWHPTMDLPHQIRNMELSISQIRQTQYKASLLTAQLARQYYLNLAGELSDLCSFDGDGFREKDCLDRMETSGYKTGLAIFYLHRMKLYFMRNEPLRAYQALQDAELYVRSLAGSAFMEEYVLFSSLIASDRYGELSGKSKKQARQILQRGMQKAVVWSKANPDMFSMHLWMLRAAAAERRGKKQKAVQCYDMALEAAQSSGFIRYQALAYERAGMFRRNIGLETAAKELFRQAAHYYELWGARSKAEMVGRELSV